ncbi:MAG: DUF885 domain-containing protein [bacterium]|nr:DUF885 domain-containing protein [bacterium]
MRNRRLFPLTGLAFLLIGSFSVVPTCVGSSLEETDIQGVLLNLEGLEFDDFVDASYEQILLRSPETVTGLGLSESLGLGNDRLDNACNSFVDETYRLEAGIHDILKTYQRSELDYEQQVTFDSYTWLFNDWAVEHEFMYHFYPVTLGGYGHNLFRFFEDTHPMETVQNAEDYVTRMEQIDDHLFCLIQNLNDSEARGIIAPAMMLEWAADLTRIIAPGSATYLPFYTALAEKTALIVELSALQRDELLARAEDVLNTSVIPAFQALTIKLDQQIPHAPPMKGVWQLPDGDRFYASRLRHHTTLDLTAAEIHHTGLAEVERIQGQVREAFALLGYPADISFAEGFDRVAVDSGIIPTDQIVPLNEGFIRQAQEDVREVFDIEPQTEVIVRGGDEGGIYVSGSLDGSRPGAYYINNQFDSPRYWMRTIAYHEAVPGHHFQIAIGNEQDVPLFTKGGGFYTAFVEGWALYAEYLVMELGWYDDDFYSELGRLQWELLRAARLVVDTGLHYYRWSRQEAIDYFIDEVGRTPEGSQQQIDRYLNLNGQATAYKTGMMKILELREHATEELGDHFDIKEFHRAVLLHNRIPLPLLERLIDDYIENKKASVRLSPKRPSGRRVAGHR